MKKIIGLSAILSVLMISSGHSAENKVEVSDARKGITLEKMLRDAPSDLGRQMNQAGGDQQFLNELFNPTLAQWIKDLGKQKAKSSGLVHEGDAVVPVLSRTITEVADLSRMQYFFKDSLHAELVGPKAKEIIAFTHSDKGRVFVSTTVTKIYPKKHYEDEDTGAKEYHQCIDVLTRITVTKVPIKTSFGLDRFVDYWHDIKNYQCRSNSPND